MNATAGKLLRPGGPDERRAAVLAWMVVIQALCALFFIGDVVFDLYAGDGQAPGHLWLEGFVALVLVFGLGVLIVELRQLLARMERVTASLMAARGEMAEVIEAFFSDWGLTPAERDVALMILKGFDNESIAGIRGRAVGTIRAQSAAIYGKAGVDGRTQLLSLFMEELLAEPE
ncbi:helix-turn-helix transcriptional regulator [Ruegeria marina]|uniref:Transcriptional regulator, LuxR family n=1 Tax=Ruegeria marina TaxID=639004 RepID=A0A1G7BXM2_9RHOB|nr:helix-turn-helix transcriptional regulator [Ruegeria marina]SDE30935.1 transcriptional regulator, LuxR family [Ruegeria marina]